uniref:Uncharacterized protein n=1 Tax=Romanomermis culicivorax TaxID=13658 RepID=A0A915JNL1_ROMCU
MTWLLEKKDRNNLDFYLHHTFDMSTMSKDNACHKEIGRTLSDIQVPLAARLKYEREASISSYTKGSNPGHWYLLTSDWRYTVKSLSFLLIPTKNSKSLG